MSSERPKLEVVPGDSTEEAGRENAPAARPPDEPRQRRWPTWLLLALLGAAVLGLAFENRRANDLGGRVESLEAVVGELEGELEASEAAVSAHQAHLDDVRSFVSELSALVERDPQAIGR